MTKTRMAKRIWKAVDDEPYLETRAFDADVRRQVLYKTGLSKDWFKIEGRVIKELNNTSF